MAEIRLRDVPKETMQKLQKVALIIRSSKTNTQLLERMIDKIVTDQDSLKQLQTRNSQIHAALMKYHNREKAEKDLLYNFIAENEAVIKNCKSRINAAKKIVKQIGTKRKTGGR